MIIADFVVDGDDDLSTNKDPQPYPFEPKKTKQETLRCRCVSPPTGLLKEVIFSSVLPSFLPFLKGKNSGFVCSTIRNDNECMFYCVFDELKGKRPRSITCVLSTEQLSSLDLKTTSADNQMEEVRRR